MSVHAGDGWGVCESKCVPQLAGSTLHWPHSNNSQSINVTNAGNSSKDGSEMTSKRTFSCVNCFLNICICVSQHQTDKKKNYTWEPVFHTALTADSGLGVKRTSKHT